MTQLARNICAMSAPLAAAPTDRIELIPVGAFKTADRRPAFRIDDPAAVIATSLASAPGRVLPIDFDHRSFKAPGDTRAAGWITGMDVEGDRIMASVEWTAEGRAALEGRAYRFVSPVFKNRPDGQVVLIEGAGLVNYPALPQLRQLASKEQDLMDPIAQIAGLLGLAADQPDAIVARVTALATAETQLASITTAAKITGGDAVTQICSRLTATAPDPTQFVPKSSFDELQTQFASLQTTVQNGQVAAALEKARDEGKLTPDLEGWATQLAAKDLGQFEAWAKVAPQRIDLGGRQRIAGRQPPVKTDALDETERQIASMMGISEDAFLATRNAAAKEA
jgi:phage I-like protein